MMYDELIEQMRSRASWLEFATIAKPSKTDGNGDAILFRKAADAIADLITALTASNEVIAKSKPKWIPVAERLLDVWKHVITFDKDYGVRVNFRCGDNVSWSIGYHVTHWMPLPEPPERDGE